MAPLRHARLSSECPFTGVDRKSPWSGQTDAIDPKRSSVSELVQRHDTFSWHRRYWPVFDPQWPSLIFTVA